MTRTSRSAALATFAAVCVVTTARALADDIAVYGSGVNDARLVLPPGSSDPHWQIVQVPAGSGFSVPRQATVARAHPAYIQNSPVGTAGSSWVAPRDDTNGFFAPGTFVYRTTFDLTGLDPATAVIDGTLLVDNWNMDVRLNGVSLGWVNAQYFSPGNFRIDHGFHTGVNTLEFDVLNDGGSAGPTGFRVALQGTAARATPADTQPPVFTGVFDRSISWQGSSITLVAASLGITAVDAVDGSVPVALSPNVVGLGTHAVTASAHDAAGNVGSATFAVRVLDVTPPVISGPTNAAPTFDWRGAVVALTPALLGLSATDDVNAAVAVTLTPTSAGFGATSVTARAVDAAGNASTKTFTVRVRDVTAPVLSGPSPATPSFGWSGSAVALTPALVGVSALDDVEGPLSVTLTPSSAGFGTTSVTARATDAAGNSSTRAFTVRVVDVAPPAISGPSASTPTFSWNGSAVALTPEILGLSASDDVDGAVAVTLSPSSAGLGSTSVTARAVDAAGNAATRTFAVRVLDVAAPVLSGPTNATPAFEWRGAAVALTPELLGLSATDDVDGAVAVTLSPSSAGLGSTAVTARAADAAGNAATRTFTVRVADTVAPTITSLRVSPDVLNSRNHSIAQVTVTATVADAGDSAPSVRIVSVTATDGGTCFPTSLSSADWNVTGALTADLRCEREGRGSGRTYVLAVSCTDAAGNSSVGTVSVFVPHDNGRASR
jgi:hypothetical protein